MFRILNMEFKDRMQQRMLKLGIKSVDIHRKLGVSKTTVSFWLNGSNEAGGNNLLALAKYLQCSPEWLKHGIGDTPTTDSNVAPAYSKDSRKFPVISWVQAGGWSEAVEPFQPGSADQWEASDANVGDKAFWLRVVGDSMTAPSGISIPEGHMILVDPSASADNGSLVVAKLTDSHEVTFKKLVIDAGQKYLKPLNPAYRTIEINGNCRIVGVVKEAKIKL